MPEVSITNAVSADVIKAQRTLTDALRVATGSSAATMRQAMAGGATPSGRRRQPWILTSDLWLQTGRALLLHAGPTASGWQFPIRAADEETAHGRVRYAQRRGFDGSSASGTYMDNQTVSFTFNGGNILPIYETAVEGQATLPTALNVGAARIQNTAQPTSIAPGLSDFYSFLELINQPPRLRGAVDGDGTGQQTFTDAIGNSRVPAFTPGQPNWTWVFYNSPKFPSLLLKGYFSPEGPQMEDSAEDPNGLSWTCSFTVYNSEPKLWSRTDLLNAFNAAFGING